MTALAMIIGMLPMALGSVKAASRTRRSAVPSSAACCSPRSPPCSSFPRCSQACTAAVSAARRCRHRLTFLKGLKVMDQPQTTKNHGNARGVARVGAVAGVVVLAFAAWGVFASHRAGAKLTEATEAQALVTVATTKPQSQSEGSLLSLPGNVQANYDAPIYARTSGYLKRWLVDIGTPVKAGQVLAEMDAPELDQQLRQAQADLANARSHSEDRRHHRRALAGTAGHGLCVEAGGGREDQPRCHRHCTVASGAGEPAASARAVGVQEDRVARSTASLPRATRMSVSSSLPAAAPGRSCSGSRIRACCGCTCACRRRTRA